MTVLLIAGHGKQPNGKNDPGATGFIKQGEHDYVKNILFPAMKKHLLKNTDVVFFSEYDVFARGNIVSLAKQHGNDTKVIEVHFDSVNTPTATGGHVIIHSSLQPDSLDLKLKDAIIKNVGARMGGLDKRSDLANCNRCASGGVNYRLIELGFGTNKKDADIMVNKVDQYAKDLVMAIFGYTLPAQPIQPVFKANDTVKLKNSATHWISKYSKVGANGVGRVAINATERKETYTVTYQYKDGSIEIAILKDGKTQTERFKAYERDFEKATGKDTLYKVQTGAFKEKANAEKLAKELKGKGYETIIVDG